MRQGLKHNSSNSNSHRNRLAGATVNRLFACERWLDPDMLTLAWAAWIRFLGYSLAWSSMLSPFWPHLTKGPCKLMLSRSRCFILFVAFIPAHPIECFLFFCFCGSVWSRSHDFRCGMRKGHRSLTNSMCACYGAPMQPAVISWPFIPTIYPSISELGQTELSLKTSHELLSQSI
eukprot:s1214_g22.t1